MEPASLVLYILLALALAGAIGMVVAKAPVRSAVSLLGTMFALAGVYALLDAHLMAAFQLIIYAGAIIVLIVYIIMLLDVESDDTRLFSHWTKLLTVPLVGALVLMVGIALAALESPEAPAVAAEYGTVDWVGSILLGPYILPFEVCSVLLLGGIVAAIYLTQPHNMDPAGEEEAS